MTLTKQKGSLMNAVTSPHPGLDGGSGSAGCARPSVPTLLMDLTVLNLAMPQLSADTSAEMVALRVFRLKAFKD